MGKKLVPIPESNLITRIPTQVDLQFDLVKVRRVESSNENGLGWGKKLLKVGKKLFKVGKKLLRKKKWKRIEK